MCYHNPSFWSAISRSDPFDVNCYIFNPDLDNGTATVIFAPGLFTALRPSMSLTLCIPHYFNHTEQCRATLQQKLRLYHIFKFLYLVFQPFPQAVFSLFVHGICHILVMSLQLLGLNRWSSFTVCNI